MIEGNGALTVNGAVQTLSGANTYTGGTKIEGGTLVLASNSAAGDAVGDVTLSGAAESHLKINSGVQILNEVIYSNTQAASDVKRVVAAFTGANTTDNYTTGTDGGLRSDFVGGRDTTAKILAGTNSSTTTEAILAMSFSKDSTASNDGIRRSDVFTVGGTTGSDTFVIELSAPELVAASGSVLGWNNSGTWGNAVDGITGGSNAGYYAKSFSAFLADFSNTFNAANMLGAYGFDSSGGSVWAVVNHGGSFTAVPEPTSALVGLLIGAGLLRRRRVA